MTPLTTPSVSKQADSSPLRRATYVHVSDLISAYNIDHALLEKEIERVNAKRIKLRTALPDEGTTSREHRIESEQIFVSGQVDDDIEINSDSSVGVPPAPSEDSDLETATGNAVQEKRLQPPKGGFNLCVLVGDLNLVVDKKRVDQSRVRLAEVEIGDETGTVSLRARDEQIDLLERVRQKGSKGAVVLRNCTLELYQGKHIRLAVTKWGKLTEYPDNVSSTPPPPSAMNKSRNFSFIDLSVVASEIAGSEQSKPLAYASVAAASPPGRQTKKADPETRKTGSSSTPPKTPSSSKKGKSTTKHHQTSRRSNKPSHPNEQRRHAWTPQYGGMNMDTNQPHSSPSQMMYHGMQGYHTYGEQNAEMEMQQQYPPHATYSHPHSQRQQDAASAQFSLHQQYEMHQRQLHQIYSGEQIRQVGQVPHHQVSPMLVHLETSFDSPAGSFPEQDDARRIGPRGAGAYPSMGAATPYQAARMNPEATSFAPSYLSAAQGSGSHRQEVSGPPLFSHYEVSQQQRSRPGTSVYPTLQQGHHGSYYVQSGVGAYHHPLPQASFEASDQQYGVDTGGTVPAATASATARRSHDPYHHQNPLSSSTKKSPSSGKENVTSK